MLLNRSRSGNSPGKSSRILRLLAELVVVVIILLVIGPLLVALSILRPTRLPENIGQLVRSGVKHAVTCTLVLASFRRLLRQEGAFLHQKCSDSKDVLWWVTTLHEMVATDSHIELGLEFPTRTVKV